MKLFIQIIQGIMKMFHPEISDIFLERLKKA